MVKFIPQMLEKVLPEALVGIIMLLILSASMSTLSSLVPVSSSAISMDLIKGALFPEVEKNFAMRFKMNATYAPNIGAVAMVASLVVVPLVSLVSAKLPQKHLEKVFAGGNAESRLEA